jgi:hypothetical protein
LSIVCVFCMTFCMTTLQCLIFVYEHHTEPFPSFSEIRKYDTQYYMFWKHYNTYVYIMFLPHTLRPFCSIFCFLCIIRKHCQHWAHHKAGKLNRWATRAPPNSGCEEDIEDNQRGNQNPYIEEEQITQWPKEKVQRTNSVSWLSFLVFITFL